MGKGINIFPKNMQAKSFFFLISSLASSVEIVTMNELQNMNGTSGTSAMEITTD